MRGDVTVYAGTQEGNGQILPFSPLVLFNCRWVEWRLLTWRKPWALPAPPIQKLILQQNILTDTPGRMWSQVTGH